MQLVTNATINDGDGDSMLTLRRRNTQEFVSFSRWIAYVLWTLLEHISPCFDEGDLVELNQAGPNKSSFHLSIYCFMQSVFRNVNTSLSFKVKEAIRHGTLNTMSCTHLI